MAKLTEEQKQKIVADYVLTQNKSETARLNNVSRTTVMRVVGQSGESALYKKVHQKKEETEQGVLEYVESLGGEVKTLIGKYVAALSDDEKIGKANPTQIATVLGILMDKFTPHIDAKDSRDSGIKITLDWERGNE